MRPQVCQGPRRALTVLGPQDVLKAPRGLQGTLKAKPDGAYLSQRVVAAGASWD